MIYNKVKKLKPYLEYAASIETAYKEYNPRDSRQGVLHNHCGCVSYVVQQILGGQIVSMKGHYWNDFDGLQLDATNVDFTLLPRFSVSRKVPARKTINKRFIKFYQRVEEQLREHPIIL